MPRRGRSVKERDPKVVQLAEGITSLIWLWAVVDFVAKGGISFFPTIGLSNRADFTPFITATLLTIPVVVGMVLVLKLQSAAGKSLDQLQSLSPDVFEDWVAARFHDLGYSVKVAGSWGDHGVDLVAEKGGKTAVIQCKNYKAWKVGEPVLRDLYGAMHDFGADKAYLVTTGQVTQAARSWAQGKPLEIWDGKMVSQLSKQFALERKYQQGQLSFSTPALEKAVVAASAEALSSPPAIQATPLTVSAQSDKPSLSCPKCGSKLMQRRNRTSGEPFLACPGYPDCRYARPLPS